MIVLLILFSAVLSSAAKSADEGTAEAKQGMSLLRQNAPLPEHGKEAAYDAVDCPMSFQTTRLEDLPKPSLTMGTYIYDRSYTWRIYRDSEQSPPCIVLEVPGKLVLSRDDAIVLQMAADGYVARSPEEIAHDKGRVEVRIPIEPSQEQCGSQSDATSSSPDASAKPKACVSSEATDKRLHSLKGDGSGQEKKR